MNYHALTRPAAPLNTLIWRMALAASLLLVLACGQLWHSGRARQLLQPPAEAPAAPPPVVVELPSNPEAEARAAEIRRALHTPWANLLLAVEKAGSKDVTLLALHPDLAKGNFAIEGEVKEFAALQAYIDRLNSSGLVSEVYLLHEEAYARDTIETVGFKVVGRVRGD